MSESITELLTRAAALQRAGRGVVACLLVKARGSTPQSAGALMLVDESANTFGTVGGGCVEAEVRRQAHALLMSGGSGVLRFKLDHDYGWDDGLICGGTIEMAVGPLPDSGALDQVVRDLRDRRATALELHAQTDQGPARFVLDLPPRDRLYIAGAGHVGQALAAAAVKLDFEVSLLDDRADMLANLGPEHGAIVAGEIAENLKAAPVDDRTYVVIVTRGHRHDEQALHAAIGRGAAYVGMIGSRRKVKLIFDDLIELGVSADDLVRVHAPIGLPIGAISVEEIAVSIAAQLVEVRRSNHRSPVRGPEPHQACAERLAVGAGLAAAGPPA